MEKQTKKARSMVMDDISSAMEIVMTGNGSATKCMALGNIEVLAVKCKILNFANNLLFISGFSISA